MLVHDAELRLQLAASSIEAFRRSQRADPMAWQLGYLLETRNTVILKGRQIGASTSASVLAIRKAISCPGSLTAIVSPSMKQSTEVKKRAQLGIRNLGLELELENVTTLGFKNGARILSLPGSAKSVRGWSADLLIIDEAAFLDQETFLAARATTAATGGRTIVQSTPAGPYGHFFDLYNEAADADTADDDVRWVRYTVSSEEVTTISPEFLASERASMTEEEFAQEYLGQFAPAGMGLVNPERLGTMVAELEESSPWSKIK